MPIHPDTLKAFAKFKLTTGEDRLTGKEVTLPDFELQMIKGIGAGFQNTNHQSWYWLINKCKGNGETPKDYVIAAKRVINPKDRKEYCIVTYAISGYTYKGKPVEERWIEKGLHWLPVFQTAPNYDKLKMEEIALVDHSEPVYEFIWKGDKTRITNWEWKEVLLTDLVTEETRYHIIDNNKQKYSVPREAFFSGTRQQLLETYAQKNPQTAALENLTKALEQAQRLTVEQN